MTGLARIWGVTTAAILTMLGLIHLYWAAGGRAGSTAALPERSGQPTFQPGPIVTVGVAGGLFAAAGVLLTRLELVRTPVNQRWASRGAWTIAMLFGLRALGDFQYVGVFKRVQGTPFARWDTALYTPLCIMIAVGSALVAGVGTDEPASVPGRRRPSTRQ
jgi:hypothetical protein